MMGEWPRGNLFPGQIPGRVIVLKVGDIVVHKEHGKGVVTSTFIGGAYVFCDERYHCCKSEDLYLKRGV